MAINGADFTPIEPLCVGDRAVFITRHAPTARSFRPWFENNPFNPAFASDLDRVIEGYQLALWIHGHIHDPVDEPVGKTRVLANLVGLPTTGADRCGCRES